MLNPQYFKTNIPGIITVEQLKQRLQSDLKDPDVRNIYVDPKQRIVVAGRLLKFTIQLKPQPSGQSAVIAKGYWSRMGLLIVAFLLFWPAFVIYIAVSWGAASRFNQAIRQVVDSFSASSVASAQQQHYQEPAVPAGAPQDYLKDLERLANLREKGVLTGDEYSAQKQRILEQLHG